LDATNVGLMPIRGLLVIIGFGDGFEVIKGIYTFYIICVYGPVG